MICCGCGCYFAQRGAWQKVCGPCYGRQKREEMGQLERENGELYAELRRLTRENEQLRRGGLDAQFVRQLLQLAHPDKHSGSELSQRVRARVLTMRE